MGITYKELAQKLQELEKKFRCTCTPGAPFSGHSLSPQTCTSPISFSGPHLVDAHIRMPPSAYGGNCQFFALDTSTADNDSVLPVVIAVGANYTQGRQHLPSSGTKSAVTTPPWIEEPLKTCRTQFINGLNAYAKKRQVWQQLAAAGANMPTTIDKFHLVMTNFCPWITAQPNPSYVNSPATGNWDALSSSVQAELLVNRARSRSCSLIFEHLDALCTALNHSSCSEVYWCAHGLKAGVFPLFRLWQLSRNCLLGDQWILLNNLARRYIHTNGANKGNTCYDDVFPYRNS